MTLSPDDCHADVFNDTLEALRLNCPYLTELSVNFACTDEVRSPILAQINGLRKLRISSPTRAILQLLPEWLERLSSSLVELHLTVCGNLPVMAFGLS